jgi:hypothetical protein
MVLLLSSTVGLLLWLVLFSISGHGFDSAIPAVLVVMLGATVQLASRTLHGDRAVADDDE